MNTYSHSSTKCTPMQRLTSPAPGWTMNSSANKNSTPPNDMCSYTSHITLMTHQHTPYNCYGKYTSLNPQMSQNCLQ